MGLGGCDLLASGGFAGVGWYLCAVRWVMLVVVFAV